MYQAERDKVADKQWNAQFEEGKRQFNVTHNNKRSSGGGGGGNKKKQEVFPQGQIGPDPYEGRYGRSDYDSWLARMNGEGEYDPNYWKNILKLDEQKEKAILPPTAPPPPKAPVNKNPDKNLGYRKVNDKINRAI